MTSSIILKKSSVAARVPVAGDLAYGELALNYADGALYYKRSDNTIQNLVSTNTGTVTSVSGAGTVSGLTLTGTVTSTGSLTLGGTLSLTSGQVTTALGFTPYNSTNPSGYITSAGTAANVSGIVAVANGGTGTATPGLVAGTNITVSGSWPNQTINATGGLTGFTAAASTAAPNATVYVNSLLVAAASTNADVALVAKGTGATLAQVPDSTTAGGNKRGTHATDWQKSRTAATQVASGNYSVITGGQDNTASGQSASVVSGSSNTASNTSSFIGGGSNNTASGNSSAVVGGFIGTAFGSYASVIGGTSNTANGTSAGVFAGQNNSANSLQSVVCGGSRNAANGSSSAVLGGQYGSARAISGYTVLPASESPIAASAGVQQAAFLVLGAETTDATATALKSNAFSLGTSNQVILVNNSAYYVRGSIIATVTGGGNTKSWDFIATIKRGANAAATSIVGAITLNVQAADAGASTWTVAVTADTTNGGLRVTATGQAATTIRWVAKLETTEVTY